MYSVYTSLFSSSAVEDVFSLSVTWECARRNRPASCVKPGVAVAVRVDYLSIGEITGNGAGYVIRSIGLSS